MIQSDLPIRDQVLILQMIRDSLPPGAGIEELEHILPGVMERFQYSQSTQQSIDTETLVGFISQLYELPEKVALATATPASKEQSQDEIPQLQESPPQEALDTVMSDKLLPRRRGRPPRRQRDTEASTALPVQTTELEEEAAQSTATIKTPALQVTPAKLGPPPTPEPAVDESSEASSTKRSRRVSTRR